MALPTTDADILALEAKCNDREGAHAVRTRIQLAALPVATQRRFLYKFEELDLHNLVRVLLQAGLSPDTRLPDSLATPVLIAAAALGRSRTLLALLEGGANHALRTPKGYTALHNAALSGNTECLRILLEHGADANAKASDDSTPLGLAIIKNQVVCVEALAPFTDSGVRDYSGYQPLHFCVVCGKVECLNLLLQQGADATARTTQGETPLHLAVCYAPHNGLECARALLPFSDLHATNAKGWQALHLCAAYGNEKCMEVLLQATLDVDARTVAGPDLSEPCRTALHLACLYDQPGVLKALLDAGASRTAADSRKYTPLHAAAGVGASACISLLLEGASAELVDAVDSEGFSPLHLGALMGRQDVCAALVAAGAQRELRAASGTTAFNFARYKHPDNAELLALLAPPRPAVEAVPPPPPTPPKAPKEEPKPAAKPVRASAPSAPTPAPTQLPTLEAELRALNARCADATSADSQAIFGLMEALRPPVAKTTKLARFVELDLGNLVELMLAAGASADSVHSSKGRTWPVVFHAAALGRTSALAALIDGHADLGGSDVRGDSLLHLAVEGGHASCVELLLDEGANPNAGNSAGATPLMAALVTGEADCVRSLLPMSDLSVYNKAGECALHVCASKGDIELLKLVLRHVSDADLEARTRPLASDAWDLDGKPFNLTALHLASGLGNAPTVEALLAHGASPTSRDSHQMTPLHHAAMSGFPDCVSLLLGTPDAPRMSASEVNAFDWMGNTALSYAVSHGEDEEEELRAECVRLLLAAGALATEDDEMGNTPLMSAAKRPAFAAAARALAPVSDLHAMNILGYNALHICVGVGNLDVFQMLLPRVQDVDARTLPGMDVKAGYNQTALHLACLHGEHAMAAALLERGACRTAVDSNGASPLVFASALGHLGCVLHLVGWPGQPAKMEPSSVNAVDQKNGLTPLHYAAHFGRSNCCGVLIGAGAKLDVRTRDGLTALDFARRREPANSALHPLHAGKWPSQLPGTVCDVCEDTATCFCPTCGGEVYCSGACMELGRTRHQAACKERCSEAERRRRG